MTLAKKPTIRSMQHLVLCKELACIAAFNLDQWPKAQKSVYRAIRILASNAVKKPSLEESGRR